MTDQSLRAKAEAALVDSIALEISSYLGENAHSVDNGGVLKWEKKRPLAGSIVRLPEVRGLLDRLEAAEKDAAGAKASFLTMRVTANEMQVRAQRAERLLKDAGKALEPFGEFATEFEDNYTMPVPDTVWPSTTRPLSDFRRARAVQASIRAATEPMEK